MLDLPINSVLPQVLAGTAETPNLVLAAPPGAGKTTGVPPALLSCSWSQGRRILLLQPRRLATRAAAPDLAEASGELQPQVDAVRDEILVALQKCADAPPLR